MATLHLGTIDVPYSASSYSGPTSPKRVIGQARRGKANTPHNAAPNTTTTGDVAEILEAKYHVMEVFYEDVGADAVAKAIEHSVADAIESLAMGAPADIDPHAGAMSEIETAFKLFLSQKEIEAVGIPGVPTKAALLGVSHRFAHPHAKRAPRPSFIDTGLYQANFKAWVD
ncbi:MAG: hypothetical protein WDN25_13390 [Acetobacteraceae bacterium]